MLKLLIASLLLINTTYANDIALGVGMLSNTPDLENSSNIDTKESTNALQVGGLYYYGFAPEFKLRTGLFYTQKNVILDSSLNNDSISLRYNYLSIPLTAQYELLYLHLALIGGVNLQYLVSDGCQGSLSNLECQGVKEESIVYPLTAGLKTTIYDAFTFELLYEYALNETAEDTKVNSFVFNVLFQL